MDSLAVDSDRLKAQWDVYTQVLRANLSVPLRHAVGNHDVWGWSNLAKFSNEPYFGKRYAQERFELESPYYSFDQAGWHFIVLDSTHRAEGDGYTARLDEDQFGWLQDELRNVPSTTPILVLSHIPILGMTPFLDGDNEASGDWRVPGAWMHIDARRIKDLFYRHPNVRVCLSGHIHLVERVEYLGVTYLCHGAGCGAWWTGPFQEFEPGYAMVDLYADGGVESRYFGYGWTARD